MYVVSSFIEDESLAREPILFVASPGADPIQQIKEHIDAEKGPGHFHEIAMGQGQGDLALAKLQECSKSGDWLCFKNVHLVVKWLQLLENEISVMKPHPNFRLWMTCEAHPKFPSSLVEASLKISVEAPPGNLL